MPLQEKKKKQQQQQRFGRSEISPVKHLKQIDRIINMIYY